MRIGIDQMDFERLKAHNAGMLALKPKNEYYDTVRSDPYQSGIGIIALREAHNLTRADLALLIGTTYQSVLAWESGERPPSRPHIRRIHQVADFLDRSGVYMAN